MSSKSKKLNESLETENTYNVSQDAVQSINARPFVGWPSFDVFWHRVVKKHYTPVIKSACKEHLIAIGVWEDQTRWIEAVKDFGIDIQ